MRWPNFFIVGAHKAGTTSLYWYMRQHPDVYMSPVKEPCYFALAGEEHEYTGPDDPANRCPYADEDRYRELFEGVADETIIGEASTLYLYHPRAPERIARSRPNARIVALLRQPVDRAYSNYLHCRRDGQEPCDDFVAALEAEEERHEAGWGPMWRYVDKGRYSIQLRRYRDLFPDEQLFIGLHDELVADPVRLARRVYEFLGVDPSFRPETDLLFNRSGSPRSRKIHGFLSHPTPLKRVLQRIVPLRVRKSRLMQRLKARIHNWNLSSPPALDGSLRAELTYALYEEEIHALQRMIEPDISDWLP